MDTTNISNLYILYNFFMIIVLFLFRMFIRKSRHNWEQITTGFFSNNDIKDIENNNLKMIVLNTLRNMIFVCLFLIIIFIIFKNKIDAYFININNETSMNLQVLISFLPLSPLALHWIKLLKMRNKA